MGLLARLRRKEPTFKSKKERKSRSSNEEEEENTPVVIISGRPRSATEPNPFSILPIAGQHGSFSQGGRKKQPSPIPNFESNPSSTTKQQYGEYASPLNTSLYKPDTLVSSSLALPIRAGHSSLRQRQEEQSDALDDRGESEEIAERMGTQSPSSVQMPELEPTASTSSRAGRLLRRASGKFMERKNSRTPASKEGGQGEYDGEVGRSLPSGSTISIASMASTMSTRPHRYQGSDLLPPHGSRDHPPTSATSNAFFRRTRALSSSSTKDVNFIDHHHSTAYFGAAARSSIDESNARGMPLTPPYSGFSTSSSNLECSAATLPSSRWKKVTGRSLRPSTAGGGESYISTQTYFSRLAPPPRGMPADDFESRTALVCQFVNGRSWEDLRGKNKVKSSMPASFKFPVASSSFIPSSASASIEWFEDEFHRFMQEDFDQGADAQSYRDLLLADVFIEARRKLGLDSGSARLHTMYDLNDTQSSPHPPPAESFDRGTDAITAAVTPAAAAGSVTLSPTFALDFNRHSHSDSLSPAPRRRRRPKTAPSEKRNLEERLAQSEIIAAHGVDKMLPALPTSSPKEKTSSPSLGDSSRRSFDAFHRSSGSMEESKDVQSQLLTPSLFSSKAITHSSLPPSPPRSNESHRFHSTAESVDHQYQSMPRLQSTKEGSVPKKQITRWSTESQASTNSSTDASLNLSNEILASRFTPERIDRSMARVRIS